MKTEKKLHVASWLHTLGVLLFITALFSVLPFIGWLIGLQSLGQLQEVGGAATFRAYGAVSLSAAGTDLYFRGVYLLMLPAAGGLALSLWSRRWQEQLVKKMF